MKMQYILWSLVVFWFSVRAFGAELIPATNEDIRMFDQQMSVQSIGKNERRDIVNLKQQEKQKRVNERKQNFGSIVSAEAHRYKGEGIDKRKAFGKWVSEQRRMNDSTGGAAPSPAGKSHTAGAGDGLENKFHRHKKDR